jgi:hypothetical protein
VLHGVLFCGLLWPLRARLTTPDRFAVAAVLEACWEALENSPLIIDRYRAATISLDYVGDSVINSCADVKCCLLGFVFAARFPVNLSIALFFVTELILALTIRDSLILNIVMLVHPIDAILAWQAAGH